MMWMRPLLLVAMSPGCALGGTFACGGPIPGTTLRDEDRPAGCTSTLTGGAR